MNPWKNLNITARWLTVVFTLVLVASVGIVTYNAFADNSKDNTNLNNGDSYDHKKTNGATQESWFSYPKNYNMPNSDKVKEMEHEYDNNSTKSNTNNNSCSSSESVVSYVGNGSTSSTIIKHNLGSFPRVIYILDLTNPPALGVDGITTIISTAGIAYVESGNDNYAPIPILNSNVVNATTIDVGQIFNQITSQTPNSKAVNFVGTNYELIALHFANSTCSSSSQPSGNDNDDDDHQ